MKNLLRKIEMPVSVVLLVLLGIWLIFDRIMGIDLFNKTQVIVMYVTMMALQGYFHWDEWTDIFR